MTLDISKIKAISLDLDDTLWPILPTIERAEKMLHDWMVDHAPMAAALFSSPAALREIRDHMATNRPELKHDLSAVRRLNQITRLLDRHEILINRHDQPPRLRNGDCGLRI